jgi:hypothetical protein
MSSNRSLKVLAIAVALSLGAPLAALADSGAHRGANDCPLRGYQIVSVSPYKIDRTSGRGSLRVLRGASVVVRAEPGLTAEWLQLTFSKHVAQMKSSRAMPGCPFGVDGVSIQVKGQGDGYRVDLIANDAQQAEQILSLVRHLGA